MMDDGSFAVTGLAGHLVISEEVKAPSGRFSDFQGTWGQFSGATSGRVSGGTRYLEARDNDAANPLQSKFGSTVDQVLPPPRGPVHPPNSSPSSLWKSLDRYA